MLGVETASMANAALWTVVCLLLQGLAQLLLHWITPYDDWKEISNGNTAAAIVVAAQAIAIALILYHAVIGNETIVQAIIWGIVGILLTVGSYVLFELATPKINIGEKIREGNAAVALVAAALMLMTAIIVSGAIS
ncbi:DUF350 domain-containing protein [Heliophilum fasciatum]|uniref:Putative membrane protein n=1 Tax=Heliophilum fasciatum TaxID=35700 RepID=A0A4R2RM48_9FIRM|nr:DUF350 domain-containing protein [Heliophilum fasciatum]MCW2278191.1 putative membrane protein [Heliophilum fasciatum]TCP63988.1 putative membrane protein [Heliophilum fasciatum]